jgi:hypothetical protein
MEAVEAFILRAKETERERVSKSDVWKREDSGG